MIKFNKIFLEYKAYLEGNSIYGVTVKKHTTNQSSKFPLITFEYPDSVNTNNATVDGIEFYDREYFKITMYVQDKNGVSKEVITDELKKWTIKFMENYLGLERTACKPIFNMETSILRTLIKYQCRVGNIYGNIVRRR